MELLCLPLLVAFMVAWRAGIGLATTSDAHALSDKSERKPTTSTSTGTDGTEELWSGLSSASAAPAVRVVTPVVNNAHIVGERQGDSTRDGDEAELVSMCLLLIVRDEESSLRANLPLWRNNADCYVFGVDDRTSDATIQAIDEVLGEDEPQKPRFVFLFTFEDFSQARNAVLDSSSEQFPDASHVLFIDADWRPDLETIDMGEIDLHHASFRFVLFDDNGQTTRLAGWLLRRNKNLRFKYRVHETLDNDAVSLSPSKLIGWEVHVVESDSSWHTKTHGHSRSAKRFMSDLGLLDLDYRDDPHDLHTLFYLGITTFSYMEATIGKGTHGLTSELQTLIKNGMFYFHQAIDLHGEEPRLEFVWSSIRWLAYGYHYFVHDTVEATKWYRECIAYDPTRVDCIVFLSRLFLDNGNLDDAWEEAKVALLHRSPSHRPVDFVYVHECFVPIQAATVISKRVSAGIVGEDSLEGLLTLGAYLVRHHREHCKHGVLVDSPDDIDRLELWFQQTTLEKGIDVAETKHRVLHSDDISFLGLLLKRWSTGARATAYSKTYLSDLPDQPSGAGNINGSILDDFPDPAAKSIVKKPATAGTATDSTSDSPIQTPPSSGAMDAESTGGSVAKSGLFSDPHTAEGVVGKINDCGKMMHEVMLELRHIEHAQSEAGVTSNGTSPRVGFAPITLAQIQQAGILNTDVAASSTRNQSSLFRALVFGGGMGRRCTEAGGLAYEELQQVISLLAQRPSSSTVSFEVTYAHPDRSVLEAARKFTATCPDELGIADGTLRFVHSSFDELLDTAIDQPFNYVDIGGPLGGGEGRTSDESFAAKEMLHGASHITPVTILDAETLKRLGPKLAPGACLRTWSFAANPFTKLLFKAAAAGTTTQISEKEYGMRPGREGQAVKDVATPSGAVAAKVGRILRNYFGIGGRKARQSSVAPGDEEVRQAAVSVGNRDNGEDSGTASDTNAEGKGERTVAVDEIDAWVRHVLAGADRLGLADIDEILSEGGFELIGLLGSDSDVITNAQQMSGASDTVTRGDIRDTFAELVEQDSGVSRWEMADFVNSLLQEPVLMHQTIAVWRDEDVGHSPSRSVQSVAVA